MKKSLLLSFIFVLALVVQAWAQQVTTVTGQVTDQSTGDVLPGVTILVKGTTVGTATDAAGNYSIKVPEGGTTLVFTFVGYQKVERAIGNSTVINTSLGLDQKQLSEVIVTGYQTKTKEDISSSVSVVTAKELEQKPNPSIDQLLQGKSAGVQVTAANGKPGANAYVRIRGTGSISGGNDPLLVVNGVQIPDNMADQFFTSINANDIENITVLKDAAAASIYGARGSNGVLVITTKSGKTSNGKITYRFQTGYSEKIPDNFEMMNSDQKLQYEYDLGYQNSYVKDYIKNNNFPAGATIFNITDAERQTVWNALGEKAVDWQDVILQRGDLTSHQISLGGTVEKTNYFFSLQKFDQKGLSVGSDFDRYTGTLNVSTDIKPWLSVGNNLTLGHTRTNELRDRNNAQNPFRAMYTYNPYEPPYNEDGSFNYTSQGFPILEAIENNPEEQKYLTGLNSFNVAVKPLEGLVISSKLGLTYNKYSREYFLKPNSVLDLYVGDPNARGSKTDNGSEEFAYDWINQINYNFKVGEDHNFGVLAFQEFQKDNFSSYRLSRKGFASGNLTTQDNGAENVGNNSTFSSAWTLFSLAGSVDYNFKQKYFLTGSLRRDGSSRFGENNRYGTFYSGSASWLLSAEPFMQQFDWLTTLKVRASYGTVGNFNIGNYAALGLYGFSNYAGQLTSIPTQVPNSDLTWESKVKRDIGVDFEVLQSRIALTLDYFHETTEDLLLATPLSSTTGFSSVTKNIGSIQNKGLEAGLNVDIIRTNDLNWSFNGNITFNKNEVLTLNEGQDEIVLNGLGVFSPGYAVATYKLVRWAGVDPQTGEAQYLTKDGEVTKEYSASDAVVLDGKSPNPKYFGGFGTSLSYKGGDFSANANYVVGNYTYNYNYLVLVSQGSGVRQNQSTLAFDYWRNPGDNTLLPKASSENPTRSTDLYLQDASFLRLRNVTLGYTLPTNLTNKVKMQSLRVYVQGQNLLTYAPNFFGDPEVGIGSAESDLTFGGQAALFSYPQTRQFTLGVDVSF